MDRLFMEMREKKVNWADAKKMLADELLWLTDEFKRHVEENGPADKISLPFFTDFMLRDREAGDAVLQEYEVARAKETPHLDYIFSLGLKACQIAERNGVDLLKADAATRQRFSDATERMLQEFHARATNINDQELQGFRVPGGEIKGAPVPAVTPSDFQSCIPPSVPHLSAPQSGITQEPQAVVNSPLLSKVIEEYCTEMQAGGLWRDKTEEENRAIFTLFIRIVSDLPMASVGFETARHCKSVIQRLPPNMNKMPQYRDKSLDEILALQPEAMSISSINKYLSRLSSLFDWARKHGYAKENFFEGLGLRQKVRADEQRERFEQSDLDLIFSTEIFTELRFVHPYYYWLPLIGLFSGARIDEICQLHLVDIRQEGGVWVFDLNDDGEKKLKSPSSKRLIPIHPRLLELGLIAYAEALKQRGQSRLFPELQHGRDGYAGPASKWFNARYTTKLGIKAGRAFHSFRHTVADHLKQRDADEKKIGAILGHHDESMTTGRYGKRYGPDLLVPVIQMLDFPTGAVKAFTLSGTQGKCSP
ncbi:MAG: site-specific integrase, partial [Magnetococcus sp. YQC-5]